MRYPREVTARNRTTTIALLSAAILLAVAALSLGCGDLFSGAQTTNTVPGTSSTAGATTISTVTKPPSTFAFGPVTTTAVPSSPARQILQQMTLRQKAAQTLLLTFTGDGGTLTPATQQLLADGPPGGVVLSIGNIGGTQPLQVLTTALQTAALNAGPGVGLFIAANQEGGSAQLIHRGVPRTPAARKLGQDRTSTRAQELASGTATGLASLGVNMVLGPVADVVSDPRSFLYDRSYAGDPTLVIDYVEPVTRAFEENGLICVVKHFPGYGNSSGDPRAGVVTSSTGQADFAKIHLRPFKAAFGAGAEGVLVSHLVATTYDPDNPASSSERIVHGLLRDGLGFRGIIVAEDVAMPGASGPAAAQANATGMRFSPAEIAVRALTAGCDLVVCSAGPATQPAIIDAIVRAVQNGSLASERLDDAVLRMLQIKLRHGLIRR